MADSDHENSLINERFSASDSDVTLRSSDGVLFKLHRKNLELYSGAFPGTEIPIRDEIVSLSESSDVLELVFQYMYKQRQPQLDSLPFDTLAGLAEAVEKYEVFPATEACKARMQMAMLDHSLEVLGYASRHGYHELCNMAAPGTLSFAAKDASPVLDLITFKAWVLYKEEVNPAGDSLFDRYGHNNDYGKTCALWPSFEQAIKVRLLSEWRCRNTAKVGEVSTLQRTQPQSCRKCQDYATKWQISVGSVLMGFTKFLK